MSFYSQQGLGLNCSNSTSMLKSLRIEGTSNSNDQSNFPTGKDLGARNGAVGV